MSRFVRSKGIQKVLSVSNIKISRHTFVFHYSWNVLVKSDENRLNLHTLFICSKWLYSLKINCEILVHMGSQTTRATPGDYLAS